MAFNFNWSPLIADTSRAREMLTTALNKSPKPPIIVDDIIVNELNLGSTPPELEILEIGDLAEDRFRGIFKMSYRGDAYLTLKTKVQANPLNTYLSTKSSFASPQPLAASSGLTIPISITLSDIRLSGFVILVFSRQKGITLVFRNDPLESLKVSSTFDSIPFIKNYLQKEIEGQLRVLFMDDLPAIIHRLSVRKFNPEYQDLEEPEKTDDSQVPVDPLSTPPQGAADPNHLDDMEYSMFSLDNPTEMHASFSQKNMLRLAALTESQRTLSLFTPSMRDTVFRAWAGATERSESSGTGTPQGRPQTLSRLTSALTSGSNWSSAASETSETPSLSSLSRPSLSSYTSASTTYTMGGATRSRTHNGRKRKHRTVNLRKSTERDVSDTASVTTNYSENASANGSGSGPFSAPSITVSEPPPPTTPIHEEREFELHTPPSSRSTSSPHKVRFQRDHEHLIRPRSAGKATGAAMEYPDPDSTPRAARPTSNVPTSRAGTSEKQRPVLRQQQTQPLHTTSSFSRLQHSDDHNKASAKSDARTAQRGIAKDKRPSFLPRSLSTTNLDGQSAATFDTSSSFSGGILEQAWIAKVAAETQSRARWERTTRGKGTGFWERNNGSGNSELESPPPAYAV